MKMYNVKFGGPITLLEALGVMFIGLKIAGFINWAWVWVTCPLWVEALIFFIIFIHWVCKD